MNIKKFLLVIILLLPFGILLACATMQSGYAPPSRHPDMEGEDLRFCTGCHDMEEAVIPFVRFNHSLYFADNHRLVAAQYDSVCDLCHRRSFCSDCHGVGVELKPSIKNQTDNYRRMPHRGDYLSRHAIDGRVNPTSCYRCHGNPKSSRTCKPCHG